jgi:RNA recognition motif-containing protein
MRPSNVLFVDCLSPEINSETLKHIFQPFGVVQQARIIVDHHGRSMGCGYVMMATAAEATQALEALSGPGGVLRVCRPPLPVADAS